MKKIFLLLLILLLPISLFAFDFGLILNNYVGLGGQDYFNYQTDILPRISFLVDDWGEFYLSAGMTLGYDNDFFYVPELLRTEFSMSFGNSGRIRAGRISYTDPLSFVASGLFDGLQFSYYSKAGAFNIGAWYTGLLYKKTANITMTQNDQALYESDVDYGDFFNTYFAPPRLLASIDWEHPSIGELLSLKIALTGQFDLSDADEKCSSQYFILKAGIPIKSFLIELGGSLELSQSAIPEENAMAFAWSVGAFWTLPTSFTSRLSFTADFAGGRPEDSDLRAFIPVTTKSYGSILQAKLSGLTALDLNYTARINRAFGTSVSASYFVRNDLGTFSGYPLGGTNSSGYALGAEIFARLIWSPISDLQLNLGGGAFLPVLGDAAPDEEAQWRIELTAVLALF